MRSSGTGDGRLVTVAATKSSDQDVVTAMDLASEALLRRRLAELRPDDAILGEEEAFRPGTSGITWVVDPIDGTVNYLYGSPAYAVSVAAVIGLDPDGRPRPGHLDGARRVRVRSRGRPVVHGRASGWARRSTGRPCGGRRATVDRLPRRHRLRIRRRQEAARRDESSRNCCRRYVIFVAWVGRRSTCARSPPERSTCTTSAGCSRGTSPPVRSSPRRQVPGHRAARAGGAGGDDGRGTARAGRGAEGVPRGARRRLRRMKTLPRRV